MPKNGGFRTACGGEFMPDTIFYHLKLKMGKASAGGL